MRAGFGCATSAGTPDAAIFLSQFGFTLTVNFKRKNIRPARKHAQVGPASQSGQFRATTTHTVKYCTYVNRIVGSVGKFTHPSFGSTTLDAQRLSPSFVRSCAIAFADPALSAFGGSRWYQQDQRRRQRRRRQRRRNNSAGVVTKAIEVDPIHYPMPSSVETFDRLFPDSYTVRRPNKGADPAAVR